MDPISTARYGMMTATAQLTASADRVAASGGPAGDVDYAQEAVTQIQASTSFKADVGVIKVADQMWRSLLEIQSN